MNLSKTFMTVLVAAAVHSCAAGVPAYSQQSSESVVVVYTTGGSKGTATHIGDGRFLTAAHVINGSEDGVLVDFRGARVPYVVVTNHTASDVALIQAKEPITLAARSIDCRVPRIGEEVEVLGHPMHWTYVYSWGRVATGPVDIPGMAWSGVFIAMPVAQGHSGSAVLDKDGRIIGIVNAGMVDQGGNAGFTFSVSGRSICSALSISN